jgi:hypothetical protein
MSAEARDAWLASRNDGEAAPNAPQTVSEYRATLARLGARFPGMVRGRSN